MMDIDVAAGPRTSRWAVSAVSSAAVDRDRARDAVAPQFRSAPDVHMVEMARRGFFSHDSADGSSPWQRLARFYPLPGTAGGR